MTTLLPILLIFVLIAVVGVLAAGVVGVARGDHRRSNQLMRARVILQAIAIVAMILAHRQQ